MGMSKSSSVTVQDLEQLYRQRFHQYLRVAEGITGDTESGLDAVQEGFANAIRSREKFRGEALASTWVWRCVVNAALSNRSPNETSLDDNDELVDDRPESSGADVRALIATLPDRQRATLFLRYYADLDYRVIAEVLGVETGTVGASLAKAHSALRRELREVQR
jgi:RNA polymerase sigma-70 factor (ECF subfamily)